MLSPSLLFVILVMAQVSGRGATNTEKRPNILLLLTDDQDVLLGSFDHMKNTKALLQEQGMTFSNAFVHTPICCPSRSSILTGRYLHNCGVRNNSISGNCYGKGWKESMEPQHTFAIHARQAGYTTAFTGKYLNQYGGGVEDYSKTDNKESNDVPKGWDHWLGLVFNSRYYNYDLIEGGEGKASRRLHHDDNYPNDYLPSVMNRQILDWISSLPEPWLIVAAWPTPHAPFTPAPWAEGTMSDYRAPLTENYNASKQFMQQKHWLLRQLHPINEVTAGKIDRYYSSRLEALLSIDAHVAEIFESLNTTGALEHTVTIYTSDNGFQFGQHRLALDKRHLYEFDIRVPFCIRGPGIPPNSESTAMIANIDIAPTILDIAEANTTELEAMDGRSIWKYVRGKEGKHNENATLPSISHFSSRTDLLITYNGEGANPCGLSECPPPWDDIWWMPDSFNNTYNCVRTIIPEIENSIYCRFEDDDEFVEFYNLQQNPNQLNNDAETLDPVQHQRYERRLQELMRCRASYCRNSS